MQLAKPDFSNLPKFEKNFYVSTGFALPTGACVLCTGCQIMQVLARFACSCM
jgi:hypothetical protein